MRGLGQNQALECIEKHVNGYKVGLKREMRERQDMKLATSPRVSKSHVARESPSSPRNALHMPKKTERSSTVKPEIELSITGLTFFPRFQDDGESSREIENCQEFKGTPTMTGLLTGSFGGK
jgi:hypothetical protein